jgi:hypothetical protein
MEIFDVFADGFAIAKNIWKKGLFNVICSDSSGFRERSGAPLCSDETSHL